MQIRPGANAPILPNPNPNPNPVDARRAASPGGSQDPPQAPPPAGPGQVARQFVRMSVAPFHRVYSVFAARVGLALRGDQAPPAQPPLRGRHVEVMPPLPTRPEVAAAHQAREQAARQPNAEAGEEVPDIDDTVQVNPNFDDVPGRGFRGPFE